MSTEQKLYPLQTDWVLPPAENISEYLEAVNRTWKDLDLSAGDVERLKKGELAVTPELAARLERLTLGRPPAAFWLRMEANYRADVARPGKLL